MRSKRRGYSKVPDADAGVKFIENVVATAENESEEHSNEIYPSGSVSPSMPCCPRSIIGIFSTIILLLIASARAKQFFLHSSSPPLDLPALTIKPVNTNEPDDTIPTRIAQKANAMIVENRLDSIEKPTEPPEPDPNLQSTEPPLTLDDKISAFDGKGAENPFYYGLTDETISECPPFYLYDWLDWSTLTVGGKAGLDPPNFKHKSDWLLLKTAMTHPKRVTKPEDAKLFFVPSLLNSMTYISSPLCIDGYCNDRLTHFCDQKLGESKWFQRYDGRDHIVVASQPFSLKYMGHQKFKNYRKCNTIRFEDLNGYPNDRILLPSLYVGHPCNVTEPKYDFAFIGNMWRWNEAEKWRFDLMHSRRDVCRWVGKSNYTYSICGKGGMCPALGEAKYGFHIRGDTYGSNRLMDIILTGRVPIFTEWGQFGIIPDWINWLYFSEKVRVTNKPDFYEDLDLMVNRGEHEYVRKQNWIKEHIDLFNFGKPRCLGMYFREFATIIDELDVTQEWKNIQAFQMQRKESRNQLS